MKLSFFSVSSSWQASLLLAYSIVTILRAQSSQAKIVINEIADKGTGASECNGEDWIELYNTGATTEAAVSLEGYLLFDDGGPLDDKAYSFGADVSIPPDGYLLLCCKGDGVSSPAFKVGGDDVISLQNPQGDTVDAVSLPDLGVVGTTYALSSSNDGEEQELVQTTTPTPGTVNIITAPVVENEPGVDDFRAQNAFGASFFGMHGKTMATADGEINYDPVIDLYVTVNETEWKTLQSHPYTETYIPVQEFKTISKSGGTTILSSPGRMRPRGQSTLVFPICLDEEALPFKLDFASTNASQTLFGVETAYLRNHWSDPSKLREWSMHRMLARFDLPYLRTRHVRFFVNDVQLGFYTFMEATDQDYVMARSYNYDAAFDTNHGALYKVKSLSHGCSGDWLVEDGDEKDSGEETNGPYAYQRGDHRPEVKKIGNEMLCYGEFLATIFPEIDSVRRDFTESGYTSVNDCGEFLLSHNLVDRDIGNKEWDAPMAEFINTHLSANGTCQYKDCSTKRNIKDQIDVDNWLKNFAVYAVTAEQDSPMGNGNNYYLATAGSSTLESPKWKIVQYDHNSDPETASDGLCDPTYSARGVENWSIVRPTCRSFSANPLAGPLLLDKDLHARYLSYVREFAESIFTDESFLYELKEQYDAISILAEDSPDFKTYGSIDGTAFFEWMEKRGRSVLDQLDLLDKGEFPEFASWNSTEPCVGANEDFSENFCSSDNAFLTGANAGSTCYGGTLNEGASHLGVTQEACENGGGGFFPYTCGEANFFVKIDTTMNDESRQFLVENWWQPLCCGNPICGNDKEFFAETNAGSTCYGGTLNEGSSHTGVTKEACENGGGLYVPYTCGEAKVFVNTEGQKTLDVGTLQFLVENWWQPECCGEGSSAPVLGEMGIVLSLMCATFVFFG